MKESLWGYLILLLGVIVTTVILLVQRVTTTSEEDYYIGQEVMKSSMLDAIDYGTYRTTGKIVMSKEKFVEVFIRRFSENVTNNKTYRLDFYDIYEEPPKASVRIRATSGDATINNETINVTLDTVLNGILESVYEQYLDGVTTTDRYFYKYTKNGVTYNYYYSKVNESNEVIGDTKEIKNGSKVILVLDKYAEIDPKEIFEYYANGKIGNSMNNVSEMLTSSACKYKDSKGNEYCKAIYDNKVIYINRRTLNYKNYTNSGFNNQTKEALSCGIKSSFDTKLSNKTYSVKYVNTTYGATIYADTSFNKESGNLSCGESVIIVDGCNYKNGSNVYCKVVNENGSNNYINKNYLSDKPQECGS